MVVGFPAGLYSTTLVCDGLALLLQDAFWFRMAYWSLIFGVISHLGAALSGIPDFLAVIREPRQKDARRPAQTHLVFGIGLLVVQVFNIAVHHSGEWSPGRSLALPVIISLVGAFLTGVQGWYGGELVYRHLVGIAAPESLAHDKHRKHH
jgi:uncharacterized membrane protein